ncbi:OLC1v1011952C1, partial [Oldenlandia corymbosa var. corymbosa]
MGALRLCVSDMDRNRMKVTKDGRKESAEQENADLSRETIKQEIRWRLRLLCLNWKKMSNTSFTSLWNSGSSGTDPPGTPRSILRTQERAKCEGFGGRVKL